MNEHEQIARDIVGHVQGIAQAIRRTRELLATRRAAGERADATPIAGFLARALRELGGTLEGGNPNPLRWHLEETPQPKEDPTGLRAAAELVVLLTRILRRQGSDALLEDVGRVWADQPNKPAGDAALDQLQRQRADERAAAARAEHETRLESAKHAKPTTTPSITTVKRVADPKPDGEFAVGEVFPVG